MTINTTLTTLRLALAALLTCSLLAGCATQTQGPTASPEDPIVIKSIAVLPVEIVTEGGSVNRPPAEEARLLKGQQAMNALLAEYFSNRPNAVLISEAQRDLFGKNFALCRTTAAVSICRAQKTDAVLLLTLHRYIEREGTEYSAATPASVTFDYKLIRAETGQTLCAGVFSETQQAVLENLFALVTSARRGFKWITAEALAKDGLAQKFNDCQYLSH